MSLLDAGLATARDAVCHVSEFACPPCQTVPRLASLAISGLGVSERLMFCDRFGQALALLEERVRLGGGGRLATTLCGLDEALGGGIPLGKLTEVVGPSGIGKTQVRQSVSVQRRCNHTSFCRAYAVWACVFLNGN